GPHEPAPEAVVDLPALTLGHQARRLELGFREALAAQVVGEVRPALQGVAHAKRRRRLAPEAPLQQEVAGGLGLRRGELGLVELCGDAMGIEQALALARRALRTRRGAGLVAQLHASSRREVLDSLGKAHPVDLHDEGDDVAALATSKAV